MSLTTPPWFRSGNNEAEERLWREEMCFLFGMSSVVFAPNERFDLLLFVILMRAPHVKWRWWRWQWRPQRWWPAPDSAPGPWTPGQRSPPVSLVRAGPQRRATGQQCGLRGLTPRPLSSQSLCSNCTGSGAGHTMSCTPLQEPRHWRPPSEHRNPAGAKSGRGRVWRELWGQNVKREAPGRQATGKGLLIATYQTESHSAYPLCGEIEWTHEAGGASTGSVMVRVWVGTDMKGSGVTGFNEWIINLLLFICIFISNLRKWICNSIRIHAYIDACIV